MSGALWVALGGAVGASARHAVNVWSMRALGGIFPWHTLFVNAVGCLVMGFLFGLFQSRWHVSDGIRLFLTTGILGGFTTFSAFSLDAMQLYQRGAVLAAGTYVVSSVLLSLAGVAAGFALARMLA